jgi:hypothetical protein
LPAAGRASRAVAEILRKGRVVLLHSSCGAAVPIGHRAVDYVEAALALIQPQLVVGLQGGVGKINRAPLNVEYPVGRSARYRGENTALAVRIRCAPNPP